MSQYHLNLPNDRSRIMALFSNPIIGLTGTLVSVIGVILAIFFFHLSNKSRDLIYEVNPAQAVVAKSGEPSHLRVFYGDQELKSDVTAAQVSIWNAGNESIRPENVLQQITIRTRPAVPILEATIRKTSRGVVSFSLDNRQLNQGIVGLSWNILEHDDGGVIQLVYAGPPSVRIEATGVLEGQRRIDHAQEEWNRKPSLDTWISKELPHSLKFTGWLTIVFGVLMLLYDLIHTPSRLVRVFFSHKAAPHRITAGVLVFLIPLIYIGYGVFVLLFRVPPSSPFGF